ncbi:MAG: heme A synthase [SAR202 cluster bacterium]|jgi:heme A synthase|nr:heme A synthase [SAR202 cluster bacterium]|tara:strand:+ start:4724 stop:5653 length:930 start_codon:yes stop_codon:yes gene_type:complete
MTITYKVVALLSLVVSFIQIALGGFVRASESGLGCPDWPLCHGKIIPPFEFHTLIEYSHRLNGSLLGILVAVLLIICIMRYRRDKQLMLANYAAFTLVVSAGILGGITVITELAWWIRLIHLGIAQFLAACLMYITYKFAFDNLSNDYSYLNPIRAWKWKIILCVSLVFLLIVSGSYMVGIGASSSCSSWPLCKGLSIPDGISYQVHMGHRYISVVTLAFVGYISIELMIHAKGNKLIKRVTHSALGLLGIQIILGAVTVWSGFSSHMKVTHLSVATLVWLSVILMSLVAEKSFSKNDLVNNVAEGKYA